MRLLKSAKIPKDMLTYMKAPNIQNIIILTPNRILNFDEIYLDLSENKIFGLKLLLSKTVFQGDISTFF